MKDRQGFSLIELLIVVAIILIIAAIAVPNLLRARISANESSTVGDVKAVINAETTFFGPTSGYGDIACMSAPNVCHPSAGTMPLLDAQIIALAPKNGYNRALEVTAQMAGTFPSVRTGFCYSAVPSTIGRSGNRSFAGDDALGVSTNPTGATCCDGAGHVLPICTALGQ